MIYRLSGFLAVVWFGSSSTPFPSPSQIIVRCRCRCHKPGSILAWHKFRWPDYHARMKGCGAPNVVSPVARPGSPFIALDMLISNGFDSLPWTRVRFPTCAEKILNLNGPRSENWQWGDICPNASGYEWKSLWSLTLRGSEKGSPGGQESAESLH